MEFPSGVLQSEQNGRSPGSTSLMPIVRPIVNNPILASINFLLRCCRCAFSAPAAEQRVYGAAEQRFVGASAPPKPKAATTNATCNGDSPPYLPSNGLRSSYLASTELCDSSGSGSNDMNGGVISEYARWEAGHQGHQGHQGQQGHRGLNGHNGASHQRQNSAVRDLAV